MCALMCPLANDEIVIYGGHNVDENACQSDGVIFNTRSGNVKETIPAGPDSLAVQTYSKGYLLADGSAVFLARDKKSDLHVASFRR